MNLLNIFSKIALYSTHERAMAFIKECIERFDYFFKSKGLDPHVFKLCGRRNYKPSRKVDHGMRRKKILFRREIKRIPNLTMHGA